MSLNWLWLHACHVCELIFFKIHFTQFGLSMRAAQKVAVINPGFSTHNLMMSQRYVFLACTCPPPSAQQVCNTTYVAVVTCTCTIPANYAVAPAGDYLVTLLDGGVPTQAQWISIGP